MVIAAIDLITASMRLLGAVASGESVTADEGNDALVVLNELIDSWALEKLLLYRAETASFTLLANDDSYTVGPGGDFNTPRPVDINSVAITYQGLQMQSRLLSVGEFNAIAMPTMSSPYPFSFFYSPTFPLGTLRCWPVPSTSMPITLSMDMQFTQLTSVSQSLSFPPGYQRLLRYALAVALAPEYGLQPDPSVVGTAARLMGIIKVANSSPPLLRGDCAITGGGFVSLAGYLAGDF